MKVGRGEDDDRSDDQQQHAEQHAAAGNKSRDECIQTLKVVNKSLCHWQKLISDECYEWMWWLWLCLESSSKNACLAEYDM